MSTTDLTALAARIEALYDVPTPDLDDDAAATVEQVMTMLDEGEIRVATPTDTGWHVNEWAKKAILLSFRTRGQSIFGPTVPSIAGSRVSTTSTLTSGMSMPP